MPDKKISDLEEATTINNEDLFIVDQSGTTKKTKFSTIIAPLNFGTLNSLLSSNGYQIFDNGLIIQWGSFSANNSYTLGSPQIIQLPIPFPNSIFFAIPTADGGASSGVEAVWMDWATANKTTKTQLGIYSNYIGICKYVAIGY